MSAVAERAPARLEAERVLSASGRVNYASPRQRCYVRKLLGWAALPTETVSETHAALFVAAGMAAPAVGRRLDVALAGLTEIGARRLIASLAHAIDARGARKGRVHREESVRAQVADVLRMAHAPRTVGEIARLIDAPDNAIAVAVRALFVAEFVLRESATGKPPYTYTWARGGAA